MSAPNVSRMRMMIGATAPIAAAVVGLAVLVGLPVCGEAPGGDGGPSRAGVAQDTAPLAVLPATGSDTGTDTGTPGSGGPRGGGAETGTTAGIDTSAIAEVLTINASTPGEPLDLKPHLVRGQITIVDFYSVYCPPCMRIAPYLERLAAARPDIVLRKVDINRKGFRGIDWESPLSRQYRLQSVPHFKIFGPDGALISEGDPAMAQIQGWLRGE